MPGKSLIHYMTDGPFHESVNRNVARQLLDGLGHMHAKGYVHLDIKPENCLMSKTGRPDAILKITDFGTARKIFDGYATQSIIFLYFLILKILIVLNFYFFF
jgi:serine/threonine protein kinase